MTQPAEQSIISTLSEAFEHSQQPKPSYLQPQTIEPQFLPEQEGEAHAVLTRGAYKDEPPHSRLFVRCSKLLTEDDMYSLFAPYGFVESIKIVEDRVTKEHKGAAFVKYGKASEAAKAKEELNGKSVAKGMMYVQLAEPKQGTSENSLVEQTDFPPNSRLFVMCPKNMTDEDLHKIFCGFGEIQHVNILSDKASGESRGVAFVKFAKASSAVKAMEDLSSLGLVQCRLAESRRQYLGKGKVNSYEEQYFNHEMNLGYAAGLPWEAPQIQSACTWTPQVEHEPSKAPRRSRSDNNYPPGSRLFISFSKPLEQHVLNRIFSQYGHLERVYLLPGKHFGYAKYSNTDDAQVAACALNNQQVDGATCRAVIANPQIPGEHGKWHAENQSQSYLSPEYNQDADNLSDSSNSSTSSGRVRRDPYGTKWVVEEPVYQSSGDAP